MPLNGNVRYSRPGVCLKAVFQTTLNIKSLRGPSESICVDSSNRAKRARGTSKKTKRCWQRDAGISIGTKGEDCVIMKNYGIMHRRNDCLPSVLVCLRETRNHASLIRKLYSHSCLFDTSGSMIQTALTTSILGKCPRTFCNIH
jgi:hypothetical protein